MSHDDDYGEPSRFRHMYRCSPMAYIGKEELEKGDKIIMPTAALARLGLFEIDYPMLFKLTNPSSGRVTHCGVLEFTAEEGVTFLPSWMMEDMQLEHGDLVSVTTATPPKGTYVKLRPHTKDFLDVSNPRAVLERTLREYSCLTSGGTIVIHYNNKKFTIDILETKPSNAICILETDCEADFAPPLDYVEPQKPANVAQESEREMAKPGPPAQANASTESHQANQSMISSITSQNVMVVTSLQQNQESLFLGGAPLLLLQMQMQRPRIPQMRAVEIQGIQREEVFA